MYVLPELGFKTVFFQTKWGKVQLNLAWVKRRNCLEIFLVQVSEKRSLWQVFAWLGPAKSATDKF